MGSGDLAPLILKFTKVEMSGQLLNQAALPFISVE
jgi:hypothetical protein